MKKYFCFSDVHSFYNALMKGLSDNGFDVNNPEHILISLGDIGDRGDDSLRIYEFLKSIPKERRILIRGNHEYLLKHLVERKFISDIDVVNGTATSLLQLNGFGYDRSLLNYRLYADPDGLNRVKKDLSKCGNSRITKEILNWIFESDEWVDYFELDNYIFVHAFIPVNLGTNTDLYKPIFEYLSQRKDGRTASREDFEISTGGCPYDLFDYHLFDEEIKNNKILVCGHGHAADFHLHYNPDKYYDEEGKPIANHTPYVGEHLIALDACTAVSGKVNVVILEEQEDNTFVFINNNKPDPIIYTTTVKETNNEQSN